MRIPINTKHMKLFESLSSVTRVKMLELLEEGPKNIGEMADLLNISSAIVTRHISLLEETGIVRTENVTGKRGIQKICSLAIDEITLYLQKNSDVKLYHAISIPIGQYTSYDVNPVCGLASTEKLIGICDDPRYFSDPDRFKAALLWFGSGWVEYSIPSYIVTSQKLRAMEISLEISSEFSGAGYKEDYPSDIHFYLNNVLLGVWTSPGDYGETRGKYTPDWWRNGSSYGLLKTIRITKEGCRIDGVELSKVSLDDVKLTYGKDITFRIAVPVDAKNVGGINIFGKGFGNYDQNIEIWLENE